MSTSGAFQLFASISSGATTKSRWRRICRQTFRSIVEAAGGTYLTKTDTDGDNPYGIEDGGVIIHEIGTARMGADPKTSVLNGYCQAHDVKNLFVTDGAGFVTNPDKNPTLTILAAFVAGVRLLTRSGQEGESVARDQPCQQIRSVVAIF